MLRYRCNRLIAVLVVVSALNLLQPAGHAQQPSPGVDVSHLQLAQPAQGDSTPSGEVDVWIALVDPPLGEASGPDAKRRPGSLGRGQQRTYSTTLESRQQ